MKYQKFGDISALLLDLCQSFSEEENVLLLQKSLEFKENQQHKQNYMKALKSFYLKNFADIKSGNYKLRRFSELNDELENASVNFNAQNLQLLPEYAIISDDKINDDKRRRLQDMLKNLKSRSK